MSKPKGIAVSESGIVRHRDLLDQRRGQPGTFTCRKKARGSWSVLFISIFPERPIQALGNRPCQVVDGRARTGHDHHLSLHARVQRGPVEGRCQIAGQ